MTSYAEFRAIADKGADENYLIDKYLFRRITMVGSWLFSFTRVSPDVVTGLSLVLSIGSVWFFMQQSTGALVVGCALIFVYHYLDHVDGELARYYAATRGRRAGIAGAYFDVLCHSFTVNIWLPAIAFGVYAVTDQPLVMLLGILSMPVMSGFSNFVAAQLLVLQLQKDPNLLTREEGRAAVAELSGKPRQIAAVQAGVRSRAGGVKLAKEIVSYPGMILLVVFAVLADALTGVVWARLVLLGFLTVVHAINGALKARRVMRIYSSI